MYLNAYVDLILDRPPWDTQATGYVWKTNRWLFLPKNYIVFCFRFIYQERNKGARLNFHKMFKVFQYYKLILVLLCLYKHIFLILLQLKVVKNKIRWNVVTYIQKVSLRSCDYRSTAAHTILYRIRDHCSKIPSSSKMWRYIL